MKHRATPDFWYYYRQLPIDIQELADRCYEFLREDPKYPSLHFKKIGQFWSVRIGIYYRALAVKEDENFVWFWIGSHPEYDKLLSGK
ncbi:ParE family toxin-like protein [Nostoc sp.]|uniref:ParE family toxin-like protein n=1 Tax=Nostoc sp. TaxID=1180 RepID=UPI002FF442A1